MGLQTGAHQILEERARQIYVEGWTWEHDDSHTDASMAVTAARLAIEGTDATMTDPLGRMSCWGILEKHKNDRIRQLVVAGALIAAEIDRLDRQNALLRKQSEIINRFGHDS